MLAKCSYLPIYLTASPGPEPADFWIMLNWCLVCPLLSVDIFGALLLLLTTNDTEGGKLLPDEALY